MQKEAGCGKTAKANAGKGCGEAKAAAGSVKAAVCDGAATGCRVPGGCERRVLPKAAVRGRLRKRRTSVEATMCDEGCHKQPCARRLRDAIVAESDRVRKAANEASAVYERLKGLKVVNAGKATACDESRVPKDCEKARAATGSRVPEDCSRQRCSRRPCVGIRASAAR